MMFWPAILLVILSITLAEVPEDAEEEYGYNHLYHGKNKY